MSECEPSPTLTPFPPQVLPLWRGLSLFGTALLYTCLWLGCGGVFTSWHLDTKALVALMILVGAHCLVEICWLLPTRLRVSGWALGAQYLEVRRGAFIKRTRIYPVGAVLFAEHRTNPVLRRLRLASVQLHDVTGTHEFGYVTDSDFRRIASFVRGESAYIEAQEVS